MFAVDSRSWKMKLLLNATSPFARLARIVMLEKRLEDKVELCWSDPWSEDEYLFSQNPLGRIPTLVTDSDIPICESHLIADYLNTQGEGNTLFPENRKDEVLHLAGLGQGLMEAAFSSVISRKYLSEEANNSVLSELRAMAIKRTLADLEQSINRYSSTEELTVGDIAVAVALDYIEFRLPELETPKKYPQLESWRANLAQRTSFQSTAFQ